MKTARTSAVFHPPALRDPLEVVYRSLGRRGAVLLLFGALFVTIGVGYFMSYTNHGAQKYVEQPIGLALAIAPLWFWGFCFIGIGLVGVLNAWWPPGKEIWGFSLLSGFCLAWAAVHFVSWTIYDTAERAWVNGAMFLLAATLLQLIAGWPEVADE
jgi:hypothetical protein